VADREEEGVLFRRLSGVGRRLLALPWIARLTASAVAV